jgi:hypothetical protein
LPAPDNYALRYVPRDQVSGVWEKVRPLLQKVSERMPGLRTANDILDDIQDGFALLWVVHPEGDPGRVVMAMETKQIDTRDGTICEIVSLGGDLMGEWFDQILAEVERMAKAQGFISIRVVGRRGWQRMMRDYRPIGVVLEKRLDG